MFQECTKIAEDWHKHALNLITHWTTGASFHKQTKALKNTFLTRVQTFAVLVMKHGEDCIIDIMGVLIRSKLLYASKTQKEALKNTFVTLVGPHCSLFLRVFYAHCPSKPLNAGKREKTQKLPPVQVKCNFLKANKLNTNSPKATSYCKIQGFVHLPTCKKNTVCKPVRQATVSCVVCPKA